ncbi:DUF6571 family protein [Kitasatospora sp. NPDC057198]|uniref:DUF6571 family protein n=1 Tax=Kitasatospora sp. NPDC057198 TaxID=3346046 RepID=UPI00362FA897
MLGYEDVLNADPDTLSVAAADWRETARKCGTMADDYGADVLSLIRDGHWKGNAAGMAHFQMVMTQNDLSAAQTEANALASLLDDAHADFTAARKQVRDAATGATGAGFRVTGTGVAVFDPSTLDPDLGNAYHHDPGARQAYQDAADEWTRTIEAGIRRATDADQRAAHALRAASDAGTTGSGHSFNSRALGGGDAADAQRAADLATRIDGLSDDERAQLANLMRANADSPEFSRTLLDRLGPDSTLKLANSLNDPGGNGGKKATYPGMEADLARVVGTATQDPNTEFYRKWREGMKQSGEKNFGSNSHPVYGYQILGTLVTKGDTTYSTPFLSDLADDIVASEKAHPAHWDFGASHDGTPYGADPLDEVLSAMGRQPDSATAYLDPEANGGNDRLHYLLKERQWPTDHNLTIAGDRGMTDPLSQSGLAAALEAAATGERAGTMHDGKHSEAQARIMHDTITITDENGGGDSITAVLRQPLANALADYVGDTHELLNGRNQPYNSHIDHNSVWTDGDTTRMSVNQASLVRFMRGLSDDPAAYGTLHRAETGQIDKDLAAIGPNPTTEQMQDSMGKGAAALGVFDAIRADTAMDLRDDKNAQADWKAKALYHVVGAPVTPIAPLGDVAQRLVDSWTYAVSLNEKDESNTQANADISDTYLEANRQMSDMIGIWAADRHMDPESHQINSVEDNLLNDRNRSSTVASRYLGRGNA